ncbi:MAG: hypothetical protein RL042_265 [Nitrospirota bacterium]
MLNDGLFAIGQLKLFFRLTGIELLPPRELFQCDYESRMLDSASIWQAEPPQQDRLFGIACNTLDLELFPVFCFGANVERLDDFPAEFCQCSWQDSMGGC